jgi:hypothetical protein
MSSPISCMRRRFVRSLAQLSQSPRHSGHTAAVIIIEPECGRCDAGTSCERSVHHDGTHDYTWVKVFDPRCSGGLLVQARGLDCASGEPILRQNLGVFMGIKQALS